MDFFLRFAYWQALLVVMPICALVAYLRYRYAHEAVYTYPLVEYLYKQDVSRRFSHQTVLYGMRVLSLLILAFLIGKPQIVDPHSQVTVEGIDIMLVLDISGSMEIKDYGSNRGSRVDVAKKEAIRFINKRTNDPIGLVIFAKNAVSRCPITLDKRVLRDIVNKLEIGTIDPDGTVLSTGIITAANRLKDAPSKSKVMIVLTDGTPSQHDTHHEVALEVTKKLGIKLYTIGIGSDEDTVMQHPMYGPIVVPGINRDLLEGLAHATGGKFFLAKNQQDMRAIYDTINNLERTTHDTSMYSTYYDIQMPFLWCILLLLLLEVLLSSTIWLKL